MDKIKCSISISLYQFKKWAINPRIYVIFISIFLYLHSMLSPIIAFCSNYGYNITPYVFPYMMCQPITVMLIMFGIVLMFCDAPFIGLEQPYIIMRSGRKQWVFGCLLYIALASIVFFLLTILFTIIILFPVIEFSFGWGKVIGTFAQTSLPAQHGISFPFSQVIFMSYTPLQAMLLTFFNSCLVSFILGTTIYVLNLKFAASTGVVAAVTLILWQMAVTKTWSGFIRYSPVSWVSLSNIDVSNNSLYPSIHYVYVILISIAFVMSCLSLRFMKREDIQVFKTV